MGEPCGTTESGQVTYSGTSIQQAEAFTFRPDSLLRPHVCGISARGRPRTNAFAYGPKISNFNIPCAIEEDLREGNGIPVTRRGMCQVTQHRQQRRTALTLAGLRSL